MCRSLWLICRLLYKVRNCLLSSWKNGNCTSGVLKCLFSWREELERNSESHTTRFWCENTASKCLWNTAVLPLPGHDEGLSSQRIWSWGYCCFQHSFHFYAWHTSAWNPTSHAETSESIPVDFTELEQNPLCTVRKPEQDKNLRRYWGEEENIIMLKYKEPKAVICSVVKQCSIPLS